MKRTMLTLVLALISVALYAQNPYLSLSGVVEKADGTVELYAPTTTLVVDVTVVCEQTLCGPYARYAQKYLGVRAPLTDRMSWQVEGAQVALADDKELYGAALPENEVTQVLHAVSQTDFATLPIDKKSSFTPTLEAAAQSAAETIFSLRKHREELITGEAGENVFGAGLQAALDEIARQEQAYLELFLGKQLSTRVSQRYSITPERSKPQYIVCRFSEEKGLLPASDLMGNMIVLQLAPEEASVIPFAEAGPKDLVTATCVVAAPTTCTVQAAGEEVARISLPIFQFGRTLTIALPRRK